MTQYRPSSERKQHTKSGSYLFVENLLLEISTAQAQRANCLRFFPHFVHFFDQSIKWHIICIWNGRCCTLWPNENRMNETTRYATSQFLMIDCLPLYLGRTMHVKNEGKKTTKTLNTKQFNVWFRDIVKVTSTCAPSQSTHAIRRRRNRLQCIHTYWLWLRLCPEKFSISRWHQATIYLSIYPLNLVCSADENRQSLLSPPFEPHTPHTLTLFILPVKVFRSKINTITTQNEHARCSHSAHKMSRKRDTKKKYFRKIFVFSSLFRFQFLFFFVRSFVADNRL